MDVPGHLLDLIRLAKPRAALFTTYTFSVSHFDAVLLPVLRSVGCQDISVLVDAEEAARCSEESRSRAAGRIYRVAPVIAPGGGYFHCKLAYLASEDDDYLAVGSGNLTASGQSLQLESFDAVSARGTPAVFRELADWMALLASLTEGTSPQAARLLAQTAPRARQAYRLNAASATAGLLPPPSLIHTLTGTARDALEAIFIAEADRAEAVTVLSPFHAPDGGPVLQLAESVEAKSLAIGLDGGRKQLVAPFAEGRFKPKNKKLARFVVPDTPRNSQRLHAKVFELQAEGKVLVATGSVNATAQSFESTKNVEVSLARWLPRSPFAWKAAEPQGYEETQEASEFEPGRELYVDAWLDSDRMLRGRLTARGATPDSARLEVFSGDTSAYVVQAELTADGAFALGPVPAFDTSQATLLTASVGQASASCWLNVHEELDIAAEERERRAAISRVLRGSYAVEDIAEVVRLLSLAATGMAAGQSASLKRSSTEAKADVEVAFSFMRWESSGRQRGGNTPLGRDPYELLVALNRWMNSDLSTSTQSELEVGASKGLKQGVQLLGGTDDESANAGPPLSPYELLDHLCQAIPVALERQPELEYGGVLAEVVASRSVDRALKQDLKMAPCISWLDRFSRFAYPESAKEDLCAVAAAMACVAAHGLEKLGEDPQLSMLREAVERFAGDTLTEDRWAVLCSKGLDRELYRRAAGQERAGVLAMHSRLAAAATLDDSLLALLRKAPKISRQAIASEPEAATFPDVIAALRERRLRRHDLLRGILDQQALDRKGCPHCGLELSPQHLTALRQKHVLFHKHIRCNQLLFFSDRSSRLQQGIRELPDA